MKRKIILSAVCVLAILFFVDLVVAQSFSRDFPIAGGALVQISNPYGRVEVTTDEERENQALVEIDSNQAISESDLRIDASASRLRIKVLPQNTGTRVDFKVTLPPRMKVRLETDKGAIHVVGDFAEAVAESQTGTIYADVSLENLKYKFQWVASKPRVISEVELEEVKEKAAGRFQIKGHLREESEPTRSEDLSDEAQKKPPSGQISLNFKTSRGIILLNVSPNEVPSNLLERPLTEAAKAIIRSGDSLLVNAIRRASPKHFGEYAATLSPRKSTPFLTKTGDKADSVHSGIKRVTVQVTDINNRAILGLAKNDFTLSERGAESEILSVKQSTTPINLVLLLDVSGSIEHYVDFIRKAARNFINTTSKKDKIAIVIFNEDVKTLSNLTTDRYFLSESLDSFDAGGGTAYYDSLAYSLTETLRTLKGDRTAIVVLSDGDDNRSFLPFSSLLGSIQESGALIYPLYVPSGLIAASATNDPNKSVDPLRNRFMSLTSKAQVEGEILAKVSGGVYYPISRVSELQKAYNDIVLQLRTSYTITYRSDSKDVRGDRASPRLKVKVRRDTAFVKLGPVVAVGDKKVSKLGKSMLPTTKSYFEKVSDVAIPLVDSPLPDELPEITGEIESIKYRQFVADKLREIRFDSLDINRAPGAFLVLGENEKLAVSRWISPKRTRSYPYERVYDTLAHVGKKVAVIPVVKDEGLGGDRDFIQWDTISLLSLLDVHVVLAYYDDAIKNPRKPDKITKQKFDSDFVNSKLKQILEFGGTPRDWNEQESRGLKSAFEKAKLAYRKISKKTGTHLHNEDRLDERIKFAETPQRFIGYSRRRSRAAQAREFVTVQRGEALSTLSKAKITITNALFGKYYFTVDETLIEPESISLIEAKHSSRAKMPSKNDIKDGLIKMMIYTNLQNVKFGERNLDHKTVIRLTAYRLNGTIDSDASANDLRDFAERNSISPRQKLFLIKLFAEARANNFKIILEHGSRSDRSVTGFESHRNMGLRK